MYVPHDPERSYWECEWKFPNTGSIVSIGLPGGEDGLAAESRGFYLDLQNRFDAVLERCRPKLEHVFRTWLNQDLPEDIFASLKLAGFGLEDARAEPIEWDVSFETTGEKWLGITVPFIGDDAQDAVVDM
jgi:hypothetical protein